MLGSASVVACIPQPLSDLRARQLCRAYRASIRMCARISLAVSATLMTACVSFGPIGVDPDRAFSGLRDIIDDLPTNGTLDVFLVHGMRIDAPQTYAEITKPVADRLHLTESDVGAEQKLVPATPTVTIDGWRVFGGDNWDANRPRVTIQTFTAPGGKHVKFYRFQYWEALAFLKCRLIVAPDTRVVGDSTRSKYCAQNSYDDVGGARLSSSSEFGNRWVKTEIMEWGLADAVIVTSAYRAVLRQAVREMLATALRDAGVEEITGAAETSNAQTELQRLAENKATRFAFISESLGSYVVHDALAQAVSSTPDAQAERRSLQPDTNARALEAIAPIVVICGASQVHMFANQLALLRFSELRVRDSSGRDMPSTESSLASDDIADRAHFFRGCPSRTAAGATMGREFGAQQVVAYHEPNDLLTYYTSDRPGDVGTENRNTINVVVPFTTKWIWFLAADPGKAHTGHPEVGKIMDMVVCGRQPKEKPRC